MNRTLVKSPPELWSEVSDVESLTRHLGEFGEITITRLEPEHTVAWEGENARGTVELEASGWGTKVTLSAAVEAEPEPEPVVDEPEPVVDEPEPVAEEPAVEIAPRSSWLRRWFRREPAKGSPVAVAEPEVVAEPELVVEPEPETPDTAPAEAVLETALDNLGAAHHRPFSREG